LCANTGVQILRKVRLSTPAIPWHRLSTAANLSLPLPSGRFSRNVTWTIQRQDCHQQLLSYPMIALWMRWRIWTSHPPSVPVTYSIVLLNVLLLPHESILRQPSQQQGQQHLRKSMTPRFQESSYTSSGDVASIRPVDPLGASRTRYDRELDELARPGNAEFAMAPPLFHTGLVVATEASIAPNIASRKTSLTSNVSASLRSTASTTAVLGIEHDTSTPDPAEVHGSGSPINRPPDEEHPIYSWAEHRLRAARGRTRHPFAPFIRVKSPEPWSLPLLRLTPLPSPDSENRSLAASLRRLENVPFVAFSDSPFRLPGPSKFLALSSADRFHRWQYTPYALRFFV
jgi:hypothetical protein